MEIKQILGNTYVLEAVAGLVPFYQTAPGEIVLMDSGYAKQDREDLLATLKAASLRPCGIIVSHTHYDHSGNVEYLRQIYGCPVAASLVEAGIAVSTNTCGMAYPGLTQEDVANRIASACYHTDRIIGPGEDRVTLGGAEFRILPLPGHTLGHIGMVTPDGVAYLADALMGEDVLEAAKLPTVRSLSLDRRAKECLTTLSCNAYVLAHRGVYTDISALVEKNTARMENRTEMVLEALDNGMSHSQWVAAVYRAVQMHSHNTFRCAVFERNTGAYIEDLVNTGRVKMSLCDGIPLYAKN